MGSHPEQSSIVLPSVTKNHMQEHFSLEWASRRWWATRFPLKYTLITQKSQIFYSLSWWSAHCSEHWVNLRQGKQMSSVSEGLLTLSSHRVHGMTKMLCLPKTLLYVSGAKKKGWNSPFFHHFCKTSDCCTHYTNLFLVICSCQTSLQGQIIYFKEFVPPFQLK